MILEARLRLRFLLDFVTTIGIMNLMGMMSMIQTVLLQIQMT